MFHLFIIVPVPQNSAFLPVGVQIAAPTWRDEQALAVMKVLEELLSKR